MIYITLQNKFVDCQEYDIKQVVVKSNFQVLLIPNDNIFQIIMIYINQKYIL